MSARRIRIGNTIAFPWQITRAGAVEDLSQVDNLKLMRYFGKIGRDGIEVPVRLANANTLTVEVPTSTADRLGDYIYELSYDIRDLSLSDEERECKIDITAFTIVARTAEADPDGEFALSSDLLIGLVGAKFESKDFTPAEWAEIQRPSIEAAQRANNAIDDITTRSNKAISDASTATDEAVGVVVTIVEDVLPAMEIAKQGAIDATQSAIDAAVGASAQAAYAEAQADRVATYELLTTEAVNEEEFNEITF
jgi:hypothetical protein